MKNHQEAEEHRMVSAILIKKENKENIWWFQDFKEKWNSQYLPSSLTSHC